MPSRRPRSPSSVGRARALQRFHPVVREWFRETLGVPSVPQERGWPAIASGENVLVLAPTGTGKTLAAFLWELNALISEGLQGPLANAVHILYVSPLKALNNDIQRNLEEPLADLRRRFLAAGLDFPEIRVAVRTGDTPASTRARMLRKSPHILITTPESLHIMLTSVRGRGMFSGVRAVIVDEIHAVAGTKRGAHLALTLERLEELVAKSPQRIGLSATQTPLDEIGRFLAGTDREVTIVDCGLVKSLEITVRSPVPDLGEVGGSIWPAVTPLVVDQIRGAHTTLIFVNNRAQAEKMAARINAAAGEELALPYHGSLSRERRFLLERRLKAGEIRALISTSALELGIDIGSVDLVLQLQSPKRVGAGLQRVGRAGHSLDETSRGIFIPTFRDDALEMLAIVAAMRAGDIEPTRVVRNSLDVLAQVLVAVVSVDDHWTSESLFRLVRRAHPYRELTRAAFDEVLGMLAGQYPAEVAAELQPRLYWDRVSDRLSASRSARMAAVVSGGTIPDRGYYAVSLPDRTRLGELDEEFVHETRTGDVFQLGSSTWRVRAIEHDRVVVTPAPGAPARMPFWHGEFSARSAHLSCRIGLLRRELNGARGADDVQALATQYGCDESTAQSLVDYVREQSASVGSVPDDHLIIVEQFRDETGAVRVVVHAPFGGRVNAPWGMALAARLREWLAQRPGSAPDVQVQTTDDGIMFRLPDLREAVPIHLLRDLTAAEARRLVVEEVGQSSLFGARFRMNAARALLLPRGNPRRRMPLWLQRLKAQDLLQAVREFPSFPILVETYRDILQDVFDLPALTDTLERVASGAIRWKAVETDAPSPFAASLQLGFVMSWMYADDAPRAERTAALLSLDLSLFDELMGGSLADEATLNMVQELLAVRRGTGARHQARTADELALLLDRAGDLTVAEMRERVADSAGATGSNPLDELLASGRAIGIEISTLSGIPELRVILREAYPRYAAAGVMGDSPRVFTGLLLEPHHALGALGEGLSTPAITRQAARKEILARFIMLVGLFSADDVAHRYGFPAEWVLDRLEEWRRAGKLVREGGDGAEAKWCSRRLLEHARRRALAAARRQIQPVTFDAFARFLQMWQHLDPAGRLSGGDGAAEAIRQLVGIARPAESWEREYLPARVDRVDRDAITRLCATGELVWIGAPPPKAVSADSLSTLRFVRRGTARAWVDPSTAPAPTLTTGASAVHSALERDGASYFDDLIASVALSNRGLRDALRELVIAGLVTNDSSESLRSVIAWRPAVPVRVRHQPDPTRWLPAGTANGRERAIVQRRISARRLPRWKRPELRDVPETWPGRWSLVRSPRVMGPEEGEEVYAAVVAQQWLARYGIVSRDWWRRERPAVAWPAIYRELKRLELRGDVRRGYFVQGLAGAQFALPNAVEQLRTCADEPQGRCVAMGATDPANPYTLPPSAGRDGELPAAHGRGTILVTCKGRVILIAESRGRRLTIRTELERDGIVAATKAFVEHSAAGRPGRDIVIETVNGIPASASPHAVALETAGFRRSSSGLRFYALAR